MSRPVEVEGATFAEHTTLRVGGAVDTWVIARTEEACIEAIVECDDLGREVVVVGGGSNIFCSDDPLAGTVVQIACTGESFEERDGFIHARVAAGEEWDAFVVRSLENGSGFLAPLSGIPGLVGATPIQNVGAYGTEVSEVITAVRVWDRRNRTLRTLTAEDCAFRYRWSAFKDDPDAFVVLGVEFMLPMDEQVVVAYPQLASELGVPQGSAAAGSAVREAVLRLRQRKGMVLDDDDHDTWSVGSFFVNPIVASDVAATLPEQCPTYPAETGVKVSAAWLIEASGVEPGFALPDSRARVSTKHTLALCNAGSASSEDVVELARVIKDRVIACFGIELQPEPRLVGVRV